MKLKLCPFCGSKAKKVNRITCEVDTSYHICETQGCLYSWMIQGCEYDQWNTRPIEDKLQAENDTLLLEVTGLNKDKDELVTDNADLNRRVALWESDYDSCVEIMQSQSAEIYALKDQLLQANFDIIRLEKRNENTN